MQFKAFQHIIKVYETRRQDYQADLSGWYPRYYYAGAYVDFDIQH